MCPDFPQIFLFNLPILFRRLSTRPRRSTERFRRVCLISTTRWATFISNWITVIRATVLFRRTASNSGHSRVRRRQIHLLEALDWADRVVAARRRVPASFPFLFVIPPFPLSLLVSRVRISAYQLDPPILTSFVLCFRCIQRFFLCENVFVGSSRFLFVFKHFIIKFLCKDGFWQRSKVFV